MRYLFFGTPTFASIILKDLLISEHPPCAIVCNPDRPVGRKKVITSPLTKQLILKNDVSKPVFQPQTLDAHFIKKIKELEPDFFVVAAYSKILPQALIDIPRRGVIGVHPSLLPKYRGATPIQTAILNGDEKTGLSLYLIDKKVDHGPLLAQGELSIHEDNYIELEARLAKLAGEMLVKLIPHFSDDTIDSKPQNDTKATFTKKFTTDDGLVKVSELKKAFLGGSIATKIHNLIRGLNPEPGIYIIHNEKRIKLLSSKLKNKKLILTTIQKEGKKPTEVEWNELP